MRVTKVIKEYIVKEVEARIAPRYAAEKAEADRQEKILDGIWDKAYEKADKVFNDYLDAELPKYDFVEDKRKEPARLQAWYSRSSIFDIKDKMRDDNVVNWEQRMRGERNKISNDIIINLELGGTRAELEDMLRKI